MTDFIQIGGWIFWLILTFTFLAIVVSIEDDKDVYLGRTSTFVIVALFIFWLLARASFNALFGGIHWGTLLLEVGGYLVLGLTWSFFRWWKFVGKNANQYRGVVAEFARDGKWYKTFGYNQGNVTVPPNKVDFIPLASQNKARISAWIIFWPFSIVRYLVGDLLRDVLDTIVEYFSGVYNKIAESRFN